MRSIVPSARLSPPLEETLLFGGCPALRIGAPPCWSSPSRLRNSPDLNRGVLAQSPFRRSEKQRAIQREREDGPHHGDCSEVDGCEPRSVGDANVSAADKVVDDRTCAPAFHDSTVHTRTSEWFAAGPLNRRKLLHAASDVQMLEHIGNPRRTQ